LEQIGDFELEAPLQYLLVDEYQDLNQCDLAVINAIVNLGVELFVAGDDDQSIYGFRKAYPEGIRRFPDDYRGAIDLPIEICKRCDVEILNLAEFVADLDTQRIRKGIRAEDGRPPGEVVLLQFPNQNDEARGIAALCDRLITQDGYSPQDILILTRVDTKKAFSRVLEHSFQQADIPISTDISSQNPLDGPSGRQVLSLLRLIHNINDHLALRTILHLRRNRIGDTIMDSIYNLSRRRSLPFSRMVQEIATNITLLPRFGQLVSRECEAILGFVNGLRDEIEARDPEDNFSAPFLDQILLWAIDEEEERLSVRDFLLEFVESSGVTTLDDLLILLEASSEDIEQELDPTSVNILTMHKAKGLTADAVIVMAAEDEYIPGRQSSEPGLGDERRLLFVSLTRARHKLFITYCVRRFGQQRMLGRTSGDSHRTLTQFLRHTPLRPVMGNSFIG